MSGTIRWSALVLVLATTTGACGGPETATAPASGAQADTERQVSPRQVEVRTSVDRTAVWIGDPVVWTVEITCAPNVDVVEDDLAAEKVQLEGLEMVRSETDRVVTDDGSLIHRVRYHLTSRDVSTPLLRTMPTAPLKVRYFVKRAGQNDADLAPAGEALVPGAVIAWRSTLPEAIESLAYRDDRSPDALPGILWLARPLGWTLVLISAAPVVMWGAGRIRKVRRPRLRRPSARATRGETLKALESLRSADTSTPAGIQEAYSQLNDALRHHVAATTGAPAAVLSTSEFAQRTFKPGSRISGEALAEILAACDRARYGRPDPLVEGDRFHATLNAAEELVKR